MNCENKKIDDMSSRIMTERLMKSNLLYMQKGVNRESSSTEYYGMET